ncbi:hypothetical protein K490DRAFT_19400, partial [Saccharata proteae CBS 121410]
EPSVLEYARYHGICADYVSDRPLDPDQFPTPPIFLLQDFEDPPYAIAVRLPPGFSSNERLGVGAAAMGLLKVACKMPDLPPPDELVPDVFPSLRELKQELPLLKTDVEMDMLNWAKPAKPDFGSVNLPFEHVDEENDEGISWPKRYYDVSGEQQVRIEAERLAVSKDILRFLQNSLKVGYGPEDEQQVIEANLTYKRRKNFEPVTPPLMPLTPPQTPFELSSGTGRLELLSESTDSVANEARLLEEQLIHKDRIASSRTSSDPMLLDDPGSPLRLTDDSMSSTPAKRRISDLRVEGPLTPPIISSGATKKLKTVSFPEMLHEYIPDLPSHFERGDDLLGSGNSFDAFFEEHVVPLAGEATRKTEQEQLQEVDTTRRVEVPVLDFTLPPAPWDAYTPKMRGKMREGLSELCIQKQLLSRCRKEEFKGMETWHGIAKIERVLPWSPFPSQLGKMSITESISEVKMLAKIVGDSTPGDIVDSASMIWKPDGLRILDESDDDDEDELQVGEYQDVDVETQDMRALLKRRNLELLEKQGQQTETAQQNLPLNPSINTAVADPVASIPSTGRDALFGGMFSASSAISKFMHARSGQKPGSAKADTKTKEVPTTPPGPEPTVAAPSDPALAQHTAVPRSRSYHRAPLPAPPSPTQLPPRPLILSSTIYTRRSLLRSLKTLYPSAQLIERDFNTSTPSAREADLLLSPGTGIVVASLQKIKQRALPGQPPSSSTDFRIHIRALAERYERLFVLVSEDGLRADDAFGAETVPITPRALDQGDCTALGELIAYVASLDNVVDISITYVGGGVQELARWIVGLVVRYGVEAGEVKLLQDETLWELFLRRAGLNAFAAQVVLASLKPASDTTLSPHTATAASSSDPDKSPSTTLSGLAAFVRMGAAERIKRFETVFGGRRVLQRLGTVLDQRWLSAADGF